MTRWARSRAPSVTRAPCNGVLVPQERPRAAAARQLTRPERLICAVTTTGRCRAERRVRVSPKRRAFGMSQSLRRLSADEVAVVLYGSRLGHVARRASAWRIVDAGHRIRVGHAYLALQPSGSRKNIDSTGPKSVTKSSAAPRSRRRDPHPVQRTPHLARGQRLIRLLGPSLRRLRINRDHRAQPGVHPGNPIKLLREDLNRGHLPSTNRLSDPTRTCTCPAPRPSATPHRTCAQSKSPRHRCI
jgi:hypothetical protein